MSAATDTIARLEALVDRLETAATQQGPEFVTVAEAARALGIGVKALRGAIHRGEVPAYHLGTRSGGRPRVHLPEVRAWALGTACDPQGDARSAGDAAAREESRQRGVRGGRRGV